MEITRRALSLLPLVAFAGKLPASPSTSQEKTWQDMNVLFEVYLGKFAHPEATRDTKFVRRAIYFPGPMTHQTWCPKCAKVQRQEIGIIKMTMDVEEGRKGELQRIREVLLSPPAGITLDEMTKSQLNGHFLVDRVYRHCLLATPIKRVAPPEGYLCYECKQAKKMEPVTGFEPATS